MKTKHIIIYSVLLALLISAFALCALNVDAAGETSGECGENLTWRYDSDTKTLYIDGYGEMTEYLQGYAPWTQYRDDTERIVLPDGITFISACAFQNFTAVTEITVPNTVTSMGSNVFSSCSSLKTVNLSNNLETVSAYAFSGCVSVESIVIPDSVKVLETSAFTRCSSLKYVDIGAGVEEIGSSFSRCAALESIVIPDNVKSIGPFAFMECASLKYVEMGDGVEIIRTQAFAYCPSLEVLKLGNGVKTVEYEAFRTCESLKVVYIPVSVEVFELDSLAQCKSLTDVYIASPAVLRIWRNGNDGYIPSVQRVYVTPEAAEQVSCLRTDIEGIESEYSEGYYLVYPIDIWNTVAVEHNYDENYAYDHDSHWLQCNGCGKKEGETFHIMETEVLKEAEIGVAGLLREYCHCGYSHEVGTPPLMEPEEESEAPLPPATEESADFEHVIISPQPMPEQGDSSSAAQASPVLMLIIIGAVVGVLGTVLINAAIVVLIIVLVKKKKNNKTSE